MRSSARFAEPTMPWPHCAYSDCILYSTSRGVKRSVAKPPDGSVRSYEAAKIQPGGIQPAGRSPGGGPLIQPGGRNDDEDDDDDNDDVIIQTFCMHARVCTYVCAHSCLVIRPFLLEP